MYVACPSCKSLYPITAEQLTAAGGQVRCSQCQTLFNALDAVFDDPREALEHEHDLQPEVAREIDELVGRALDRFPDSVDDSAAQPRDQAEGEAPIDAAESQAPQAVETASELSEAANEATEIGRAVAAHASPGLRADADPYAHPVAAEFASAVEPDEDPFDLPPALLLRDTPYPEARTRWGMIAAGLLLTVTLLAQYVWWDRNRLAQITALRPTLDWLCRPLACELPLRHDLARVEMVEREVRDHPHVADALLVSAAFVNRADYPQAYPVLQIAFSDISGTPVAVRRFLPEEYLHDKQQGSGMAPGERTLVMLEVVDPGEKAVSFQFDFM